MKLQTFDEFLNESHSNIIDMNDIQLKNGDIIDIHQTVNGQNIFVIKSLSPLDIRYKFNMSKYEYDKDDLLSADNHTGETTFEIIGNIKNKK